MTFPRRDFLATITSWPATVRAAVNSRGAQSGQGRQTRWRGFNLPDKIHATDHKPFNERDFDFIAEHGFNFVRLPMHYKCWTKAPGQYDESSLAQVDQAIAWARARRIHVNVALHSAPGHGGGKEPGLNLWAPGDAGAPARSQFAVQWQMLAQRYRDIDAGDLSFNLANEPPRVPGHVYAEAVRPAVEAIRRASPQRLIIADATPGKAPALAPVPELFPLMLGQSVRGYIPFGLTHWHAPYVAVSDSFPPPAWPLPNRVSQSLYAPSKKELHAPMVILCDLRVPTRLSLHIAYVSVMARLEIRADGRVLATQEFHPGPGSGDWKKSFPEGPNLYEAFYDANRDVVLPAGTRKIELVLTQGDWLTVSGLSFRNADGTGKPAVIEPALVEYGRLQQTYVLRQDGSLAPEHGPAVYDRNVLAAETIDPWRAAVRKVPLVHVGEWGAENTVPHGVVLAWMADCLRLWRDMNWGWALWQLHGPFGVIDSGRRDVTYEQVSGRPVDRKMLELLKSG